MRNQSEQTVFKKQYFQKEMKERTPMGIHLMEVKEITDKLSSIGASNFRLGSLPSKYSTCNRVRKCKDLLISID